MRTQLLVSIFVFCFNLVGTNAQICTPKGTTLDYYDLPAGSETEIAAWEQQALNWINTYLDTTTQYVKRIGPADGSYNCHSYAWHTSQNGNKDWLNAFLTTDMNNFNPYNQNATPPSPNNINKYWNDGSYVEVTSVSQAQKVWYGSNWTWCTQCWPNQWINLYDHSGTTTSNTNRYKSKWGFWPLYEHDYNACPYTSTSRKFYKLNLPIAGDNILCTSNKSYTLTNNPSGTTSWSVNPSSYVTPSSGTSNPAVIHASSGSVSGYFNITYSLTTCGNATYQILSPSFWVGRPHSPSITATLRNWGSYWEIRYFATQIENVTYIWKIDGNPQEATGAFCSFIAPECGGDPALVFQDFNVEVSVINECDTSTTCNIFRFECGYTPTITMIGYCGGGNEEMMAGNEISILVTPNPARDYIKISILKNVIQIGNAIYKNITSNESPNTIIPYRLSIISNFGVTVFSSNLSDNSITIPIYNLMNGNYIVKLDTGFKSYSQQFIINH